MTYTATVTNETGFAVSGASVNAAVPSGLSLTTATPDTGSYNATTGVWTVGDMAVGATAQIVMECTVTGSDLDEINFMFYSSGVASVIGAVNDSVNVRSFVGALGTRAAAYQSAVAASVPVGGEPEQDWATGVGAGTDDVTYIIPGVCARQDCSVTGARMKITTLGTGTWKLKVFRWSVDTFTYIGERELTVSGTGAQTATCTAIDVQMGDVFGVYVPSGSALETIDDTRVVNLRYVGADVTADNAFADTVTTYSIPLDVYGNRPYLAATGDSIAEGHNADPNLWEGWFENISADTIPGGEPTSEIWNQIRADVAELEYQTHAFAGQFWSWVRSTAMPYVALCAPHTVVTICGTNDISNGRAWHAVSEDLVAIKAAAEAAGARRLAICEVLPRSEFTDAEAATVRDWNSRLATWCKRNGAQLITCHDSMGEERVATGELDDLPAAYDAGDGIHLSAAGVEALSELIQDQL